MNIAFIFVAFLVMAAVLWGIGEMNYKNFHYEEDKPHHPCLLYTSDAADE